MRSFHSVRDAVEGGVDSVLHEAALPSEPRSVRDPITTNDANVVRTLNRVTASRDARVNRLVHASSVDAVVAEGVLRRKLLFSSLYLPL
jgi:nucleoside-diphosphate-sugar epimerase